jgi:hypothetical protein
MPASRNCPDQWPFGGERDVNELDMRLGVVLISKKLAVGNKADALSRAHGSGLRAHSTPFVAAIVVQESTVRESTHEHTG